MRKVALSEVKDDLSRFLRAAEKEAIVITRHGRPAGVLVGFANEDDWFDYRLQNDPRFLQRIDAARSGLRAGKGVRIEDLALDTIPSEIDKPKPVQGATTRSARSTSRRAKTKVVAKVSE